MRLGFNFWLGAGLTALMTVTGILAPWLAPFDPVLDANLMNSELPPDATLTTFARFTLGVASGPGFSDLGKSKEILFGEIK